MAHQLQRGVLLAFVACLYFGNGDRIVSLELDTNGMVFGDTSAAYETERIVMAGLKRIANQAVAPTQNVAVGFGGCVDVTVPAIPLLEGLRIEPGIAKHHDSIATMEELQETFSYFFSQGAAGERYVSNKELWAEMLSVAAGLSDSVWDIGGNALLMGQRIALEGGSVVQLGALDAADLYPSELSEAQGDNVSQHPRIRTRLDPHLVIEGLAGARSDVHMVLEYTRGTTWGAAYTAPRANRLILHSDEHNPRLVGLQAMSERLLGGSGSGDLLGAAAMPQTFVLGGLQLMQDFPYAAAGLQGDASDPHPASSQLRRVSSFLHSLLTAASPAPPPAIHFEYASVSEPAFIDQLHSLVLPSASSVGCNEQELGSMYYALRYGSLALAQDQAPRVADVLDKMSFVFSDLRTRFGRLSRLHVHTLAYQAVMVLKPHHTDTNTDTDSSSSDDSSSSASGGSSGGPSCCPSGGGSGGGEWAPSAPAMARASLMASHWVCGVGMGVHAASSSSPSTPVDAAAAAAASATTGAVGAAAGSSSDDEAADAAGGGDGAATMTGGGEDEAVRMLLDGSFTRSMRQGARRIPLDPRSPVTCWEEELNALQHPSEGEETEEEGATTGTTGREEQQRAAEVDGRARMVVEFCVAPVLVCENPVRTGGAGDNISATGLFYHLL